MNQRGEKSKAAFRLQKIVLRIVFFPAGFQKPFGLRSLVNTEAAKWDVLKVGGANEI